MPPAKKPYSTLLISRSFRLREKEIFAHQQETAWGSRSPSYSKAIRRAENDEPKFK